MIPTIVVLAHTVDRPNTRKLVTLLKADPDVAVWTLDDIAAGSDTDAAIENALSSARVIVAMLTADFLASRYFYNLLSRLSLVSATVIPVLLRDCIWHLPPLQPFEAEMLPSTAGVLSTHYALISSRSNPATWSAVATAILNKAKQP